MKKVYLFVLPFFILVFSSTVSFGVVDTKLKGKEVLFTQKKEQQKRSKKGVFKRLKERLSFKKQRTKGRDLKAKKIIMRNTRYAMTLSKSSLNISIILLASPFFPYVLLLIPFLIIASLVSLIYALSALNKIRKDKTEEDYSKAENVLYKSLTRSILSLLLGALVTLGWFMFLWYG